jgi:hypothetical protein
MGHVLYVEVSRVPGDPLRLGDAVDYLASEVRPAVEGQHDSLGTALLISPEAGVARFESFWAPGARWPGMKTRTRRACARRPGGPARRSAPSVTRSWCSSGTSRPRSPGLRDGLRIPVERVAHIELLSFTIPGMRWDRVPAGPAAVPDDQALLTWYFLVAGHVDSRDRSTAEPIFPGSGPAG